MKFMSIIPNVFKKYFLFDLINFYQDSKIFFSKISTQPQKEY